MSVEILVAGLIILGFLLVLIEIFLVPGINVFGITGFVMVASGIIFAYLKLDTRVANFLVIASVAASIILVTTAVKSKSWNRMILKANQEKARGFHSSADSLASTIGKRGLSYTKLRPAGVALIGEEKVDVVAEGSFIEKDRPIEVILVEGNRVVVREIQADQSNTKPKEGAI